MAKHRALNRNVRVERSVEFIDDTYGLLEQTLIRKLGSMAYIPQRNNLRISLLSHHVVLSAAERSDRLRQTTPATLQSEFIRNLPLSAKQAIDATIDHPYVYATNNSWVLGLTVHSPTMEQERGSLARRLYQKAGLQYEPITESLHVQVARDESLQVIEQAAKAIGASGLKGSCITAQPVVVRIFK